MKGMKKSPVSGKATGKMGKKMMGGKANMSYAPTRHVMGKQKK